MKPAIHTKKMLKNIFWGIFDEFLLVKQLVHILAQKCPNGEKKTSFKKYFSMDSLKRSSSGVLNFFSELLKKKLQCHFWNISKEILKKNATGATKMPLKARNRKTQNKKLIY